MSGDQEDEHFQNQMKRRVLGVAIASDMLSLSKKLSNLGECALQNQAINGYLPRLNKALQNVQSLDNADFEDPDGYTIFKSASHAYECTEFLLAFQEQLSEQDRNRL